MPSIEAQLTAVYDLVEELNRVTLELQTAVAETRANLKGECPSDHPDS